jgi:hypothetical protein
MKLSACAESKVDLRIIDKVLGMKMALGKKPWPCAEIM